jgi:hypothetical protein
MTCESTYEVYLDTGRIQKVVQVPTQYDHVWLLGQACLE